MPINVAPPRAQIQQNGVKSFLKSYLNFYATYFTSRTSFKNATQTRCSLFFHSLLGEKKQQQTHPKVSEKSGQLVRVAFEKEIIFESGPMPTS